MANKQHIARVAGRLARQWLPVAKRSGGIAGNLAGKAAGQAAKGWIPSARTSGQFVKHVLPAAVKPIHSLWHEILGFIFLMFAAIGTWKIWHHAGTLSPVQLAIIVVFIAVMAVYGVSSIRKSRRITRS